MSNIKYAIFCRYDRWGRTGKEWSNWFIYYGRHYFDTEDEAKIELKNIYEQCKSTDKIFKTLREFKIEQIDLDLLPTPAPPPPPKEKKKRGRPKKNAEA